MKKTLFYFLIASTTLLFHSCDEKSKSETKEATSKNPLIEQVTAIENEVEYTMNGSCDDFISRLDFSSFCFTSKKTPKYRLVQNTETNCQIEFYDDSGYQTVTLSIVFSDFEKPMKKNAEPNPEMAKMLFKTFFKKNIQRRMLETEKAILNLGDEAYIGFSQNKDEQVLGVKKANVSFRFIFSHGKVEARQSCMEAEEDLIRLGLVVIENLSE
jgi:hypothetical protein